ncbi:hypothetical protein D3C72_870120 [compost metagenome]
MKHVGEEIERRRRAPAPRFQARPPQRQAIGPLGRGIAFGIRLREAEGQGACDLAGHAVEVRPQGDAQSLLQFDRTTTAGRLQPAARPIRGRPTVALAPEPRDQLTGRQWVGLELTQTPPEPGFQRQPERLPHLQTSPILSCGVIAIKLRHGGAKFTQGLVRLCLDQAADENHGSAPAWSGAIPGERLGEGGLFGGSRIV